MNSGRYILTQVLEGIHWQILNRLIERYGIRARHFGCRQQLICMAFAQLTWRESLRDIEECLNAKGPNTLYHLGLRGPVARVTLAEANEQRDWRLWRDLASGLTDRARKLYAGEDLGLDLDNTVYALDSTTIDLSLTLFPWADFRTSKAGIKMHTQIDLRGPIPVLIDVRTAAGHDVLWLDELIFEPGAFYLLDRGYMDFARLHRIAAAGAFFVTRAKDNLRFTRHTSSPKACGSGVTSDQVGRPTSAKAREAFASLLRRIGFVDPDTGKKLVFLTNHLEVPATTAALLYKSRWQIELFFRWIKQHLRIKHFYGTSPNAVKTQVWIAVTVYLLIAILHKTLKLPGSLHRTMQILSVHPFEKVTLHELLAETVNKNIAYYNPNQLLLW